MGMNPFHLTNEAMEQALAKAMMPGDRFSCPVYVSFGRPSVFSSSLSNQYGYAAVTESNCLVVVRYNMLVMKLSSQYYALQDLQSLSVGRGIGSLTSIKLTFAAGTGTEQLHLRVSPKVYMSGLTGQAQNLEGLIDVLERWK